MSRLASLIVGPNLGLRNADTGVKTLRWLAFPSGRGIIGGEGTGCAARLLTVQGTVGSLREWGGELPRGQRGSSVPPTLIEPGDIRPGLRSDRELRDIFVGGLQPHNAPVTLAGYDPGWARLFAREARRIRAVAGDVVLRIEHVGSTSVPGLAAKPIIDIVLVVPDSANEPSYLPSLESAGYRLRVREPGWFEHRMLKGPDTDINMHVFSPGAAEVDRMLRFRDRLRANAADRDLYLQAKRKLAARTWRHVQHYADAKTAVIQEIMGRANAAE